MSEKINAEALAEILGGKRSGVNGSYRCHCPAHEDETASLSVKDGEKRLLVKCHAGCPFELIASAIREKHGVNISQCASGYIPDRSLDGKKLVAEYVYTDDRWRPVAKKLRFEDDNGKTMRWQRLDGGRWVSGLDGVQKTGMLYRKPDIRRAVKAGVPIHICEGEKACDLLVTMQIPATCQPDGAGEGKFTREHAICFSGADVVVWADLDEVGERYASEVADRLRPFAKSIRIVQSKTGRRHDDAYDHFKAGYSLDEATERQDLLPQYGHPFTMISSYEPCLPSFLWEPYLPSGKLVLLDADGGTGKTTFCLAVAASFGLGVIPGTSNPTAKVRTLYYGDEDDPGEYRVVYDACGGDPEMLGICTQKFQLNDRGLSDLKSTIQEGGFGLVVFDALLYYLAGIVKDANQSYDVGPWIAGISRVARETGSTIIGIRHTAKRSADAEAKHLGLGSVQFRNSARGQLVMRYHPSDRGVRVVTHEKGSILTPQGRPFAWRRAGYGVEWIGEIADPWAKEDSPNDGQVVPRQAEANLLLVSLSKDSDEARIRSEFQRRGILHLLDTAYEETGLPRSVASLEI